MIEAYKFGEIKVDGLLYHQDIVIIKSTIHAIKIIPWIRASGHSVSIDDISNFLSDEIKIILFGTGAYGIMQVNKETAEYLKHKGIDFHVYKTNQVIDKFNALPEGLAALHLTC